MNLTENIYRTAKKLGVCDMLQGKENSEQLMELFLTPQGIEFCANHNFPDLQTWRMFQGDDAENRGIYIETDINRKNEKVAALIGNCTAELEYDDPQKLHHVIVMHGAKAHIKASGYAVVAVTNAGGEITTEVSDYAKIL